jgi:hypothetical protein
MEGMRLSTFARGLAAAATAGLAMLVTGAGVSTTLAASTPAPAPGVTAPKATATPKPTATAKATATPKATPTPKATAPVSKPVPAPVACGTGKSGSDKDTDKDSDSDKDSGDTDKDSKETDKDSEDTDKADGSSVENAAAITCPAPGGVPVPVTLPVPASGVAGVTASHPPAAKAVATPKTGAELPLGVGLLLTGLGIGALAAGRRLRRTSGR